MVRSDPAFVSVALCTYNGAAFLREQVDSILLQTHLPFEIVIVDDGSTDGTKDILSFYEQSHLNIRVYHNEVNLGLNKNFEKAISLCRGEYIAISDQDDIWIPTKLEKLLVGIGDNWVIFSNSEIADQDGNSTGKLLIKDLSPPKNYQNILLVNFVTGHTCLISSQIVEYIFPIPEKGFYDWWIGFVALYHHKLIYLDEILTRYRVHINSVIQKELRPERKLNTDKTLLNQLTIFAEYKQLDQKERNFILKLKEGFTTGKSGISNPLFFYLFRNYSKFFPRKTNRNFLSKLNFLRKFFKQHRQLAYSKIH